MYHFTTLYSHLKHIRSQNSDTHRELTSLSFSSLFLSASSFFPLFQRRTKPLFLSSTAKWFELRNTRAMCFFYSNVTSHMARPGTRTRYPYPDLIESRPQTPASQLFLAGRRARTGHEIETFHHGVRCSFVV